MTSALTPRILPMKTAGTEHFIERTYREGGAFQWVRETLVNALERRPSAAVPAGSPPGRT